MTIGSYSPNHTSPQLAQLDRVLKELNSRSASDSFSTRKLRVEILHLKFHEDRNLNHLLNALEEIDEMGYFLPPSKEAKRHYLMGKTLKKAGESDSALACFRRAMGADPREKYALAFLRLSRSQQVTSPQESAGKELQIR